MKNVNLKKEFDFLLGEGEKTTYSRRFSFNKRVNYLVMAIVCVTLVLVDCFFLGAGFIFSRFEKSALSRTMLIVAFALKLIVDLVIAAVWVGFIQEHEEKALNTFLTVTDRQALVTSLVDGTASFCAFSLAEVEAVITKKVLSVKVLLKQGEKKAVCSLPKKDYAKLEELLG